MKVFIIDEDPIFSESLRNHLLNTGIELVYNFHFISDALKEGLLIPDIVIMEHSINGIIGLDLIPTIQKKLPKSKIFYVTSQRKVEVLAQVKLLGVEHYFKKDKEVFKNILTAIRLKNNRKTKRPKHILSLIKNKLSKKSVPIIFLMDDDPLFSTFIRHKISKFSDFNIKIFEEKKDLFAAAYENPDLLFLDYNLTNTTGNVIIKEFKTVCPETKVVMFTSQQNINTALMLFDSGIADYVVKNNKWEKSLKAVLEKQLNLTLH